LKPERVQPRSPDYPPALLLGGAGWTPPVIHTLGNLALLRQPLTALCSSTQCPGEVILRSFDQVAQLRDAGTAVISGFDTPVEKECLAILLRGTSPIIICPARSLDSFGFPALWQKPLADGRLLLLSCFSGGPRRPTTQSAHRRNEFVAALATNILVLYATPGGRLASLLHDHSDETPIAAPLTIQPPPARRASRAP
jgi:predicted Rossmann fold nucleotide-binding protein DprA/Smf involved in DNA uptake